MPIDLTSLSDADLMSLYEKTKADQLPSQPARDPTPYRVAIVGTSADAPTFGESVARQAGLTARAGLNALHLLSQWEPMPSAGP